MAVGHDDAPMPAIARQQDEVRKQLLRARVDREIDAIARGEVGDLLRGSLMQVELDLRVALAELANDRGELVARQGVLRADLQRAASIAALLFGPSMYV